MRKVVKYYIPKKGLVILTIKVQFNVDFNNFNFWCSKIIDNFYQIRDTTTTTTILRLTIKLILNQTIKSE